MHLEHAKTGGLLKDPGPGRGLELVGARLKRQGVRAIGTAERTPMGQLGQKSQRPQEGISHPSQLQELLVGERTTHRRACARAAPYRSPQGPRQWRSKS